MQNVKYMGTKRSLAPEIARRISDRHPKAIVVDAFAGMCAVGTAAASRHRVFANDIHAFAEVIARALLVNGAPIPLPSQAREDLDKPFDRNWQSLLSALDERLEKEDRILEAVKKRHKWKALRAFSLDELAGEVPRTLAYGKQTRPYDLFSSYFSSAYFGVRQAAEIDCLRYAIDQADNKRWDTYLSALLVAASACSASPGHFAEFLVPRIEKNTLYVARVRGRSITQCFYDALLNFRRATCLNRRGNRVFRLDATDLMKQLASRRSRAPLAIYADPPFSRAQYSRYYHVLETLVRYDYPAATGQGRYRDDRFQTDFSRLGKVVETFDAFIEAAAATGGSIYLSYPKNGLLYKAGGDLLTTLKKHYSKARIETSMELNHSTMGGAPGVAAIKVTEEVYYAEH